MIKVNLLSPEKKEPGAGAPAQSFVGGEEKESKLNMGAVVGAVIVTFGVIGYLYWMQSNEFDSKRRLLSEKEARKAELTETLKTVEQLEATKKALDSKVKIIVELRGRQQSAVRMMDEVSKALPENVWLTRLTFNQTQINLEGKASTNDLVADFIDNMVASNFFTNARFNGSSRVKEKGLDIFTFKLTFDFNEEILKQKEM